jgi:hypothetical protein
MPVAYSDGASPHNRMEKNMSEKKNWKLQPGVDIGPEVVDEVAKIACALRSLSASRPLPWNARAARTTCGRSWTMAWKPWPASSSGDHHNHPTQNEEQ